MFCLTVKRGGFALSKQQPTLAFTEAGTPEWDPWQRGILLGTQSVTPVTTVASRDDRTARLWWFSNIWTVNYISSSFPLQFRYSDPPPFSQMRLLAPSMLTGTDCKFKLSQSRSIQQKCASNQYTHASWRPTVLNRMP